LNNNDTLTGYYNIIQITSDFKFVIDTIFDFSITNNASVSKVIKYTMPPDIQGEAKLDISNTIKDFVTEDLQDLNDIYTGASTEFSFSLVCGDEYQYQLAFDSSDTTGSYYKIIASGLTATTQVDYSVGDEIVIQQDLAEWDFFDNYFTSGSLGFTGSTTPPFSLGNAITVTGQEEETSYNGPTTVSDIGNNYVVTDKGFTTSTPADDGVIYGLVASEYNTTGIVTDIEYQYGTGVVITTDIPTDTNTSVGGLTFYGDRRVRTFPNVLDVGDFQAYNARIENIDYSVNAFDPYVGRVRAPENNNISTILGNTERYRIEKDSKSWLLAHTDDLGGFTSSPRFTFYDSSDNVISQIRIDNTEDYDDYYFPIGINQITACTNTTLISGNWLTGVTRPVEYYKVELERLASLFTNPHWFEVNDDCSAYDLLHLMWKDSKGSWLSMPFKLKSRDNIEVDRKSYYKNEGNWSNDTFGYDSYGRGQKNYYLRSRESKVLNSGWLDQFEVDLIRDLFQSPSVYVQLPDDTLIACEIEQNKIELIKGSNNEMIQYQFNVIYSSNNYRF
jgi:hypothetical protein